MVVCYHFGLRPSADFPISAGMVCGILSSVIGKAFARKLALYIDGSCSGAEIAAAPREPTKYIGVACSWVSALLKGKFLDIASGIGCALAPSAGHSLGGLLESKHELDVAVDVALHHRCIKYSPTHFGSPWLAVGCSRRDHGFSSLPRWSPPPNGGSPADGPPSSGGGSPGGSPSHDSRASDSGGTSLSISPSSIVAGQWLYVDSNFRCDNSALDTLLVTEIFPQGSSIDGLTDSTHASYWVNDTPIISEDGPLGGDPELEPGNYEVAAACERDGLLISESEHSPLTITDFGRTFQISPEVVAHGDTITLTPDEPCASVAGMAVNLRIEIWDSESGLNYTADNIGATGSGCSWGPVHYTFPSGSPYDLWSGNCRMTVEIFDPITLEHGFDYYSQTIQLTS